MCAQGMNVRGFSWGMHENRTLSNGMKSSLLLGLKVEDCLTSCYRKNIMIFCIVLSLRVHSAWSAI